MITYIFRNLLVLQTYARALQQKIGEVDVDYVKLFSELLVHFS